MACSKYTEYMLQAFRRLLTADAQWTAIMMEYNSGLVEIARRWLDAHNVEHPEEFMQSVGSTREGCSLPRVILTGEREGDILSFITWPISEIDAENVVCILNDEPVLCKIKKEGLK